MDSMSWSKGLDVEVGGHGVVSHAGSAATRLLADRDVQPLDPVLGSAVDDRDVGTQEHVIFQRHITQTAVRADIDTPAEFNFGVTMRLWDSVFGTRYRKRAHLPRVEGGSQP